MKPNDVLTHFGILGMKWGRRKGASKITVAKKASEDHDITKKVKGKDASELSNAELKKFSERKALEKQYKELTKKQVSAGRKFVTDLLISMAKEQATAFAKGQLTKMVAKRTNPVR